MNSARQTLLLFGLALAIGATPRMTYSEEFEQEPIAYSRSQPDNAVSQLSQRIDAGDLELAFDPQTGYLRSLLAALDVPVSSQTLVYSKTSLQRDRIAPRTPRAIYFNDDVYVGFCKNGNVLEIAVADPKLGAVFYTLDQDSADQDAGTRPTLRRQGDNCLICHASSQTKNVPGLVVRSVFTEASGLPDLSAGSYRIDHTSPFEKRWGGWYVTGTHGTQKHLGNLIVRGRTNPDAIDNATGLNVTSLEGRFDASDYLSPHSDLVALMVLEHQTSGHNYLTQANFLTRQAMHQQQALNRELREPADHVWDSTKSRIKSACEPLVEYFLFSGEAKLTARLEGTSGFAAEFANRGPHDQEGRSLRDFDLQRRLFKHPCSYLIYSPSFAALPPEARDYVLRRLWEVLSDQDQSDKFAHLSPADRRAVREILIATLPDLPPDWREAVRE